jgi:WD40 repeat protein
VAFNPDGKLLATADSDGTARIWDVPAGSQAGLAIETAGVVRDVAFSPDGMLLATADFDGTARLWDVATHVQVGPALPAAVSGAEAGAVAFSPAGGLLATSDISGPLRLWTIPVLRDLLPQDCAIAGRPLSRQQWSSYGAPVAYLTVCG